MLLSDIYYGNKPAYALDLSQFRYASGKIFTSFYINGVTYIHPNEGIYYNDRTYTPDSFFIYLDDKKYSIENLVIWKESIDYGWVTTFSFLQPSPLDFELAKIVKIYPVGHIKGCEDIFGVCKYAIRVGNAVMPLLTYLGNSIGSVNCITVNTCAEQVYNIEVKDMEKFWLLVAKNKFVRG